MKIRSTSDRSRLVAKLRAMRQTGALALVSLSTLRAVSTIEAREADRLTRQIVAQGRTDDAITDQETAGTVARIGLYAEATPTRHALSGYLLSRAERNEVGAASAFVMRSPVPAKEEPLPPGFVPAPVPAYVPIMIDTLTDEERARLADEARAEVAASDARDRLLSDAVDFTSDLESGIVDYSPRVPVMAIRHVNRVATQDRRDPIDEHAALLRAVLGNTPLRRSTVNA